MPNSMGANVVHFKRDANSKWEVGIGVTVDGNMQAIVDSKGEKIPAPIYDYNDYPFQGSFNINVRNREDQ